MIINLFEVFVLSNTFKFDNYSLSLSGRTFSRPDVKSFDVKASGTVKKDLNEVHLEMKVDLKFNCLCDSCADPVSKQLCFDFNHLITESGKESEDIDSIRVDGYKLDLDSLIVEDILLEFPSKILCKDDCLGLCQKCGKNLNYGNCSCDRRNVDPRLSVLEDLLN